MRIIFTKSAFKHGLTKNQITYALSNIIKSKRIYNKKYDSHNIWVIALLPNGNDCKLVYLY